MTSIAIIPTDNLTHAEQCEKTISDNVRMYLRFQGLTQSSLTEPLGIVPQAVSMKMNGKTAWSVADLVNVADFLGVGIEDLLDNTLLQKVENRYTQHNNRKAADVSAASELPRLGLNQRHFD